MGFSDFTDEFETLGNSAKQQVKQVPKQVANTVKQQITGSAQQNSATSQQVPANPTGNSDADKQQMLEQMYGSAPAKQSNQVRSKSGQQQNPQSVKSMITGSHPKEKTPEEQAKLQQLREQLHHQVYFKQIEEAGLAKQQEPRVEEKKEQEEQEKKQKESLELQKDQKKQEDLAVANARKGTGEQLKGVGG